MLFKDLFTTLFIFSKHFVLVEDAVGVRQEYTLNWVEIGQYPNTHACTPRGNLAQAINLHACFWDMSRKQRTWKKHIQIWIENSEQWGSDVSHCTTGPPLTFYYSLLYIALRDPRGNPVQCSWSCCIVWYLSQMYPSTDCLTPHC